MNWWVTYRGKDGKQEQMVLESESRDGVFSALGERGISAIRVEQIVGKPKKARHLETRSLMKVAFVVAIICAISVGTWLWLGKETRDSPDTVKHQKRNSRIAAVTPAQPTPAKPVEEPQIEDTSKPIGPQKVGEVRDGYVLLPNGKMHRRRGVKTVEPGGVDRSHPAAIFDHSTDNEFAVILTLQPGESLIGGPLRHSGNYKESFLESLKTPIIVSKDDSEEVQALKRAVIETRLQMKDALDRGEDIGKIVEEAYVEAQKLSLYKDTLREEINEAVRNEDMTDKDLDDLIAAANRMLEAKGIAPMKFGALTRARIRNLRR